jgi:Fur family ferric uptake transcriptional regulator
MANSKAMPTSAAAPSASILSLRGIPSPRCSGQPCGQAHIKSSRATPDKLAGSETANDIKPAATDPPAETPMAESIIARCEAKGLRMTDQRRIVARVIGAAEDHPDVEALYNRASAIDPRISIATVYRTVKLFEEAGILERLEFGDGRARYEDAERDHHDHLIDMNSGEVIEFVDPEIEALQERIAARLGYRLIGHRLELYGIPAKKG